MTSSTVLAPIRLDREVLSGLQLKSVSNPSQPNRRLFQKRLCKGNDISVYVVSSETATAQQEDLGMEEFIYLINGRSRLNSVDGPEVIFKKGDYFVAPQGFTGEWETQGGNEFLIELSVIANERENIVIDDRSKTLPVEISPSLLSGYGIYPTEEFPQNRTYEAEAYVGQQLTVKVHAEHPRHRDFVDVKDQLIQILSGKVRIVDVDEKEHEFLTGDWFVLPEGIVGSWESFGHGLTRWISVSATHS